MTPEGKFKAQVIKWLKVQKHTKYIVKEAMALRGIADLIICNNGHYFEWELKKSEAEARKQTGRIVLQRHELKKTMKAGGSGYIVYPENFEEMKRVFMKFNRK